MTDRSNELPNDDRPPAAARTDTATRVRAPGIGDTTAGARAAVTRRRLLGAGAGAALAAPLAASLTASLAGLAPRQARAQDAWPSKPVRMVVPYPAGGVVDVVTRTVCERVSQSIGQPIVVEAKPGANANIGTEYVVRAPHDGYTFLVGSPFLVTNPMLLSTTKWKTSEFVGVGLIGAPPNVFVVPASLPVKTMKELVALAKAKPNQLNISNPGVGSSNHMGQELLLSLTGIEMQEVKYKGQPEMLPDYFSGQISFGLVTIALALPHIKDGKLRALALSAPRRSPELPDVPTIAEAGYPDAMFLPWYGIVATAATPRPIVRRMSDEIHKALANPEVVARLEKMGTQITPGSAEEFDKLIASEIKRWTEVIRKRGIKPAG